MNKIGKVISLARKKAGLTQESFAAKLGITPQAVSKWENDVGYIPM
jgi:transcriptional regulator with XRE-family HTH domain